MSNFKTKNHEITNELNSFCSYHRPFANRKPKWDYPVKQGSEKWKTFTSSEEMVKACQIPEDVLNNISTKDLLELCLKYPMFLDIHFSNNLQEGLDIIIPSFNGLVTLLKRENFSGALLDSYTIEIPKDPHVKIGNNKLKIFCLELLLCQDNVLNKLDVDQRKNLLKLSLKRISDKKEKKYSVCYQLSSALVTSRLIAMSEMKDELNSDEWLINFNTKGILIDSVKIEKLVKIAQKLQ